MIRLPNLFRLPPLSGDGGIRHWPLASLSLFLTHPPLGHWHSTCWILWLGFCSLESLLSILRDLYTRLPSSCHARFQHLPHRTGQSERPWSFFCPVYLGPSSSFSPVRQLGSPTTPIQPRKVDVTCPLLCPTVRQKRSRGRRSSGRILWPRIHIFVLFGGLCVRVFFCVWEWVDLQPLLDFPSSIRRTPETKKKVNFLIKPHPISKSFLISLNMSNIRRERVTDEKTVRQTPE